MTRSDGEYIDLIHAGDQASLKELSEALSKGNPTAKRVLVTLLKESNRKVEGMLLKQFHKGNYAAGQLILQTFYVYAESIIRGQLQLEGGVEEAKASWAEDLTVKFMASLGADPQQLSSLSGIKGQIYLLAVKFVQNYLRQEREEEQVEHVSMERPLSSLIATSEAESVLGEVPLSSFCKESGASSPVPVSSAGEAEASVKHEPPLSRERSGIGRAVPSASGAFRARSGQEVALRGRLAPKVAQALPLVAQRDPEAYRVFTAHYFAGRTYGAIMKDMGCQDPLQAGHAIWRAFNLIQDEISRSKRK